MEEIILQLLLIEQTYFCFRIRSTPSLVHPGRSTQNIAKCLINIIMPFILLSDNAEIKILRIIVSWLFFFIVHTHVGSHFVIMNSFKFSL